MTCFNGERYAILENPVAFTGFSFSKEFVVKVSPSELEQEYKIATSIYRLELVFLLLNKLLVLEMLKNKTKYKIIC